MNTRLYVGNLSFNTNADGVRAAFEQFGTVTDVHLVTDRETGRARGFAFVTMGTPEEAAKAIKSMDGAAVSPCSGCNYQPHGISSAPGHAGYACGHCASAGPGCIHPG